MRLLVRLAPTRLILLLLADRGILRARTEEALKLELLTRSRGAEVVALEPPPADAEPAQRSAAR